MKNIWRFGLTLMIAGIFGYSGWIKAIHPLDFAAAIAGYRVLSPWSTAWAAVILPTFELLLGASLIVPRFRRSAAGVALVLLGVFAAATFQAQIRHLNVECGCFGPDPWRPLRLIPPLIRDGLLVAATAALRRLESEARPGP